MLLAASVTFGYFWVKSYFKESELRIQKLSEDIVAARIQESTRVFNDRLKEVDEKTKSYLKYNGKKITDIGVTIAELKQTVIKYANASHEYKAKTGDTNEQYYYEIPMTDAEGKEIALAWFIVYPNRETPNNVKFGIKPGITFNVKNVLAEGKDFDESVSQAWMENLKKEKFPLKISHTEWVRKSPEGFKFDPNFSLSVVAEMERQYPAVGISLFRYSDIFRFVKVGLGYDDEIIGVFNPIEYNLPIPWTSNLLLGPEVSIGMDGKYDFGLSLAVLF